ncbi:MAG: serine hydrolase [Gemmatimonadetes bacterium]|nr:serine hydrolase [Gemmatimonadota bacterium]
MPRPPVPPTGEWNELGDESYGMGLFLNNYRGHRLVHHGGNIDGFSAELNFLPSDSIGVVVLTNLNGTQVRDFIPYLVYDRLLGLTPIDWSKRFKERQAATQARARKRRPRRTRYGARERSRAIRWTSTWGRIPTRDTAP